MPKRRDVAPITVLRRIAMEGSGPKPAWSTVVAVAAVVGAAALDVLTPPSAVLKSLTVLGPLLASLGSTWRQTAVVGVFAWTTALLLGIPDGIFLREPHLVPLGLVAIGGALCVYVAAQREQRLGAMRRLASVAEMAQQVMLRPPPRVLGHVGLAARYVSASDEARVGGDLYETAFTPYGVRIVIGDVRGKGLEGIRLAANVLATFRETVWDRDLADLARTIDKRLSRETSEEDFVTAVLVEFPENGGVSLVNCGHHPPLRLRDGQATALEPAEPTLPLGLGPDPQIEHFDLEARDRILLSTDGMTEARDRQGAFFAAEQHIDALTLPELQHSVDALLERLLEHVAGDLQDDLAILLAERRS
ncbi:MAG: SpoIIE family protein phosphatase [Nitriliruptorales bacterium]|nr:SpoIIE family protein phosphatase [Nitriliruptorales bacterium]